MCIIFYYIFLALSTMFYIYESIAQYKANGAYTMVTGATIMLNVINQSIKHICVRGNIKIKKAN